jgi:uncharacterized membrane protein (DUF485 family)
VGEVSVKFRLPVSLMMYVMMVLFLGSTVFLVAFAVAILTGVIQPNPPLSVGSLLGIGVVLPVASFLSFLYTVKCIFFNYHELTDREFIVSTPPFHVRVPLEEIVEIETDPGKISASFGRSVDVKSGEGEFEGGRFKFYGATVTSVGGKKMVECLFSGENLVLIRAKRHEITMNVPDVKEFVELVSKAVQMRKSELKL